MKRAWAWILLFALLTVGPVVCWPFLQSSLAGENTENRTLAEAPVFDPARPGDFPAAFEAWFGDHLPFRRQLIQANSALRYYGFHAALNENVAPGRDGWLFYNGESSPDFLTGEKRYTEEELAEMTSRFQALKDRLEEQGIRFLLLIPPNKERVYPACLPASYGEPEDDCALYQVLAAFEERSDVRVVCLYEALLQAEAEHPDRLLYRMTDTHWNDWGASVGVREMLRALGVPWEDSGFTVTREADIPGDLADMLNLAGIIDPGPTWTVSGYQREGTTLDAYDNLGSIRFSNPSLDTGKLLLCRDSFCASMAPLLGHAFSETCLTHLSSFSVDQIEAEQPDYFVLELVERNLDYLLALEL